MFFIFSTSFLAASQANAYVEGNIISRELKREYSGITALPIARYLGLDESCNGRRLNKIILEASSSAGPGLATLIVNGIPVGVTKEISSDLKSYEFPLDPDYNYLGQHILNMEIRLSGDFYIEHIEARLADTTEAQDDPWEMYPIKIGKTDEIGSELKSTVFQIAPEDSHLSRVLFIAQKNDFFIHRVIVQLSDGHKKSIWSCRYRKGHCKAYRYRGM
jgi:hypothetical protein